MISAPLLATRVFLPSSPCLIFTREGLPVVGSTGITFEVWGKWRKKDKKLGTLTVSVGGLRWHPAKGKWTRRHDWREVADWLRDDSRRRRRQRS